MQKLNIKILLSAVGDKLPKNWKMQPDFISDLKKKAEQSWNERLQGERSVRFLHKMPSAYGSHFRFFTVTQREDGSLLVSKGGCDE